ncbi:MAG: 3-mercaptopyruvate sulfurtransferase [Proteobacteria bacterium]|nr:3-mercaptopyruvate sulfurtransferase [Pseudomonadota bacterium]
MDYANPRALVSTEWLAENLSAPGVRIVDATFFLPTQDRDAKAESAAAHLPGAVFFDVDDIRDPTSDLPHMLPSAEIFSAKMGTLGIGDGDHVIAYDANGGAMAAARAWWMFRIFGHGNVSLLDGGLPKWLAEGRPMTDEAARPKKRTFTAEKNPSLVRAIGQMLANVETAAEQVADARSRDRFDGSAPEPREGLRSGHIPGSVCLPYPMLMDGENHFVMRPAEDIAAAIADAGLDMERPVVASCGSGVTAAMLAFGFYLLGKEDVAVYDGSWTEWGGREDTPVET